MKNTKTVIGILVITILLFVTGVSVEASPSSYFNISKYWYLNENGDYEEYKTHGFYQNPATSAPSPKNTLKLFLFPTFSIDSKDIKFTDQDGLESSIPKQIKQISILIKSSLIMPNDQQQVSIGSAILGKSVTRYIPPLAKNSQGKPNIFSPSQQNLDIVNAIIKTYAEHDIIMQTQDEARIKWEYYLKQLADIQDVTISLSIGNETFSQTYDGSLITDGSYLPAIYIINPSVSTVNLIRDGNFGVTVTFKTIDSDYKGASALINYSQIVHETLRESQSVITKSRNTGVRLWFLNFSKDKFEQIVNYSLSQNKEIDKRTKVNIIYDDATEEIIKEFQSLLFPHITLNQTIKYHEEAAIKATAEGNAKLAEIHRGYADGLRNDNKMQQADILASAAALAEGDYASFIANGVRGGYGAGDYSNNYIRVISKDFSATIEDTYKIHKNFSVLRKSQIYITPQGFAYPEERYPYTGAEDYAMPFKTLSRTGLTSVIALTGIEEGSPFMLAGFQPGMLITRINFHGCYNLQQYKAALKDAASGADLPVSYLDLQVQPPFMMPVWVQKEVNITPKEGYIIHK